MKKFDLNKRNLTIFAIILVANLVFAAVQVGHLSASHKSCTGATGGGWCSYAGFDLVECGHPGDDECGAN